jgi:coatomer protein complex subunit alpha (xenin)
LYLITGNIETLQKMFKISEMRGDVMGQFHNALYLGDVPERVKILENAGHHALAYLTAATHGMKEDAERLEAVLVEAGIAVPEVTEGEEIAPLTPPKPIIVGDNWPLLTVSKGFFEGVLSGEVDASAYAEGGFDDEAGAGWGDDLDIDLGGDDDKEKEEDPLAAAGLAAGSDEEKEGGDGSDSDAGWDMEDLDLPPDVGGGDDDAGLVGPSEVFVAPTAGIPPSRRWTEKSAVPGEHAAAGDFDAAMKLLNRQLGVINFAPLKQHFIDAAFATHASMTATSMGPNLTFPLGRDWNADAPVGKTPQPALVSSLAVLEAKLKAAYKARSPHTGSHTTAFAW